MVAGDGGSDGQAEGRGSAAAAGADSAAAGASSGESTQSGDAASAGRQEGGQEKAARGQDRAGANQAGEHEDPHHRSHRILNQGGSTIKARYIQPVVAKHGNLFLLTGQDGDIVGGSEHGLYFRDMRYLCNEQLRVDGLALQPLLVNASAGSVALFELSNPDLPGPDSESTIRKETLGIRREHVLGEDYTETIRVRNHATEEARFDLALSYDADFADMFAVRGAPLGERGTLRDPRWDGDCLIFQYDGADGHTRRIELDFDPRPDHRLHAAAGWQVDVKNQQTWQLTIHGRLEDRAAGGRTFRPHRDDAPPDSAVEAAHKGSIGRGMAVESSSQLFNEVLARSLLDLHMLSMREAGQEFFAAGVPWYVALFGRDSLITAIEMAAFDPGIAAHTLKVLAEHQGTKVDDFHDEQPGKILHELRFGEMANLGEVPQTPYYGSVDSTPLFLVLVGLHARWDGKLDVYHSLRKNVDAALEWIDRYGDSDGDGLVDYATKSKKGLHNQGWKDSFNAIVMENGQLAKLPVALPEVQSWVYRAWLAIADLRRRDGDEDGARELESKAARLRDAFEQTFWLADEDFYGLCREGDGAVSKVISSNGVHALYGGIVPPQKAARVAARALQPDLFCGWGVRTMSSGAVAYNPIDYQVGSVWPHDNALISAGLHAYGCVEEANRIFEAIYSAAITFDHFRLPEVFAGYDQAYSSVPVNYPVACSPQAWAAGSIPLLLQTALGLEANGFERELRIFRPRLPGFLEWVRVRDLRVGGATIQLRYERSGSATLVAVEQVKGDVRILVEY